MLLIFRFFFQFKTFFTRFNLLVTLLDPFDNNIFNLPQPPLHQKLHSRQPDDRIRPRKHLLHRDLSTQRLPLRSRNRLLRASQTKRVLRRAHIKNFANQQRRLLQMDRQQFKSRTSIKNVCFHATSTSVLNSRTSLLADERGYLSVQPFEFNEAQEKIVEHRIFFHTWLGCSVGRRHGLRGRENDAC